MLYIDARLTFNQHSSNDRPDYDQVHAAMRDIGFFQRLEGLRFLPGMYRCSTRYTTLVEARAAIQKAIAPLGFHFQIQLIRVEEELDFQFTPAPSFFGSLYDIGSVPTANIFGSLAGASVDSIWARTEPLTATPQSSPLKALTSVGKIK